MRTLLALIALSSTVHAQARWTPFHSQSDIPKDRWGSSYGFTMDGKDPVVTKRYAYPPPKPFLWHGDRIVSVRGKSVASASDALAALDGATQKTIPIKVERKYSNGETKTISVTLTRSNMAEMDRWHRINIDWALPNVDAGSFGQFEGVVEWVGVTIDPVTKLSCNCYRIPSGAKVSRDYKQVASRIGTFMFRDCRPKDGHDDFELAEFPRGQWKSGQLVQISKVFVWVEPEQEVELNGKKVSVTVLTLFHPDYESPAQSSP